MNYYIKETGCIVFFFLNCKMIISLENGEKKGDSYHHKKFCNRYIVLTPSRSFKDPIQ